jgi:hypothetical protein
MLQESIQALNKPTRFGPAARDYLSKVDLEHVREIAKVTLGFIHELASYKFPRDRPPVNLPVWKCKAKCPWERG